jgi:hypothetical protein
VVNIACIFREDKCFTTFEKYTEMSEEWDNWGNDFGLHL